MFLKLSITTLTLIVLAGCSANYKNRTDFKLCYQLATVPAIFLGARADEVRSRGLDCRVYADRIDEQERAIKLEKAGATRIDNRTTVQQPIKWKKDEPDICGKNEYGVYIYCN